MGGATRRLREEAAALEARREEALREDKRLRSERRRVAGDSDPMEPFRGLEEFFVRDPRQFVSRLRSRDPGKERKERALWLFGRWPGPAALSGVWLGEGPDCSVDGEFPGRRWDAALRSGRSFAVAAPGLLTRRQAHWFLGCRHGLEIRRALFWAVCRAAGASDAAALALARSSIGGMPFDDYWKRCAQILSLDPPAGGSAALSDLSDFLRRARARRGWSLAGRTRASLAEAQRRWHAELALLREIGGAAWEGAAMEDFEWADPDSGTVWTIRQILSSDGLAEEGTRMSHCVRSYLGRCVSGESSIWSVRSDSGSGPRRRLTVELSAEGTLRQARGLANRAPREAEARVLRRWASVAGLRIAPDAWACGG